jgi:competence protein ComEA
MRQTRGEAVRRLAAVGVAGRSRAGAGSPPAGGWVPAPQRELGPDAGSEEVDAVPVQPRVVRPAAALAAAVVAVVVGLVGWLHAQGSGDAVQLAPRESRTSVSPAAAAAGSGPALPAAPSPAPSSAGVVVDVEGRVRRPGLQRLPPGARVADAVRGAGGTTSGAVLTALNLARLLADGEQVVVPGPGDPVPAGVGGGGGPGGAASGGGSGGPGGTGAAGSPLDLNTATEAGLDELPGVGPVLAGRIIAWRSQHGRFTSVDELAEVPGIGPKVLERLRPLVRV